MERASGPQVHAPDGRALGPELGDLCWGSEQNVPKTLSVRSHQDSCLPPALLGSVSQIPAPTPDLRWALGTHDHVPAAHGVHAQVWQKGKRPLLGSFLRPSACAAHLRAQRRQVKPRFCAGLRPSNCPLRFPDPHPCKPGNSSFQRSEYERDMVNTTNLQEEKKP